MSPRIPRIGACLRTALRLGMATAVFWAGCSRIPFEPGPVVPSKVRLPQSVKIVLADIGAYTVEPGSTMLPDLQLQNHVTEQVASLTAEKLRWEQAVADYASARRTFRSVLTDGQAELEFRLRLMIYIDPSLGFLFDTIYVARAEGELREAGAARAMSEYSGFGKAAGVVRRRGPRDDEAPVNQAVHAALNDLFGKVESDGRLAGPRAPALAH